MISNRRRERAGIRRGHAVAAEPVETRSRYVCAVVTFEASVRFGVELDVREISSRSVSTLSRSRALRWDPFETPVDRHQRACDIPSEEAGSQNVCTLVAHQRLVTHLALLAMHHQLEPIFEQRLNGPEPFTDATSNCGSWPMSAATSTAADPVVRATRRLRTSLVSGRVVTAGAGLQLGVPRCDPLDGQTNSAVFSGRAC